MGSSAFVARLISYSLITSFLSMKHQHLNNSKFGGAAPPGGAEMRCA